MSSIDFRVRDNKCVATIKSVVASPNPPNSRMTVRNARCVYPAKGAKKYRDGNVRLPIVICSGSSGKGFNTKPVVIMKYNRRECTLGLV